MVMWLDRTDGDQLVAIMHDNEGDEVEMFFPSFSDAEVVAYRAGYEPKLLMTGGEFLE